MAGPTHGIELSDGDRVRRLPDRAPSRPRRHGNPLPGDRAGPGAPGGAEADRPRGRRRRGLRPPLRRGVEDRRLDRAPERGADLRRRRRGAACPTSRCATSPAPTSPAGSSARGASRPAVAVELIAQIGNGLDAIHAAGLVHRDVKPANVLLSGGEGAEHAYITDFGVARNVATESGLTQTGRFVGTLDYVAPEQISGGAVDARVDVYALGCLLFKLLTGEVPFPKDGEAARLYAHLNDPPPAPSLYVPEVSMALDDVVIRAMSKSPDDRYPSAGDLGRAAQAALRGEAPVVPERTVATGAAATRTAETIAAEDRGDPGRVPATEPTRRLADDSSATSRARIGRHRRRWALAGGAAALVAALVVVIVLVSGGGGSSSGTPGETDASATTPTTAAKAEAEAQAEDPDQVPADRQGRRDLRREQEHLHERALAGLEESPDVPYAATLPDLQRGSTASAASTHRRRSNRPSASTCRPRNGSCATTARR